MTQSDGGPPPRSLRAGRAWMVAAVLVPLSVASTGLGAWTLRRDTRLAAGREAQATGAASAEQMLRALDAALAALEEVDAKVDRKPPGTAGVPTLARPGLQAFLANRMKELPQVGALQVLDPAGGLVAGSQPWPLPVQTVAGSQYVSYCSRHGDGGVFVSSSGPLINGEDAFYLARCLAGADGKLLGIAVAAIRTSYFSTFYRALGLQRHTVITVRQADGGVLLRYPPNTRPAPEDEVAYTAALPIAAGAAGIEIRMTRSGDGAPWLNTLEWLGLGAACALASLALALGRQGRLVRGLAASRAAVADRDLALATGHVQWERQALALARSAEAMMRIEAMVSKQTGLLQITLDNMDQGLVVVTADRTVAVCNRRAMEMLDLPAALMESQPNISDVLAYQWQQEEFITAPQDVKDFLRSGGMSEAPLLYERRRPNGTVVEVRIIPLEGGGSMKTYTDITERKRAAEHLTFLAYHDELTGLANRYAMNEALDKAVGEAGAGGNSLAVLYMDLDRFKLVNDTQGHATGDRLLQQVAARLRSCLRSHDFAARLGGDEFAAILPTGAEADTALALAERIRAAVSEPYDLAGCICHIGVSIGVASFPMDADTPENLLQSADAALYRAKAIGRNTICWHDSSQARQEQLRRTLERDLRPALEAGQFELLYQPVVDTDTNLPVALEALIRWRHPEHGLLEPRAFIPIAEQTGQIGALGHWVLQTACKEAAIWAMPVRLAVNVSSLQFARPELAMDVAAALEASGLPADRLSLDVTESTISAATGLVRGTMAALRQRGIRLAMDGFGTGNSSLRALQGLPFQQLKIDQGFVADMASEEGAAAIVRAILAMAASMHLEVVAEGVETQAQYEALRRMGCRYMQGFLLQPPQTAAWSRDYLWHCTVGRAEGLPAIAS